MSIPRRPTGSNGEANFAKAVWDICFKNGPLKFNSSNTVQVNRTSNGIYFTAAAPSKSSAESAPADPVLKMFKIRVVENDTLTCREWNGSSLSGSDISVAKPIRFRCSKTSEIIEGVTMTYTYSDKNNRLASDGVNSQYEVLYPRYVPYGTYVGMDDYSIIWAAISQNGTGINGVDWIEVSPQRVWARRYIY